MPLLSYAQVRSSAVGTETEEANKKTVPSRVGRAPAEAVHECWSLGTVPGLTENWPPGICQ